MPDNWEEWLRRGALDALAYLQCRDDGDMEGTSAVIGHASLEEIAAIITAMADLLLDLLEEHGIGRDEWIAEQRRWLQEPPA